jgi:hypothetical protein
MKIEPRYPFRAHDYIYITDTQQFYRVIQEPIHFFDYLNYYVAAKSTQTITLNGQSITSPVGTLHVPNLTTPNYNQLNQAYFALDSLDIIATFKVNGIDMFYLAPKGTALTAVNSPIRANSSEWDHFIWSATTTIIPEVTITNLNPVAPVYAAGPQLGIQVWGYTYLLQPVPASEVISIERLPNGQIRKKQIHSYSTVTITPKNSIGGGVA